MITSSMGGIHVAAAVAALAFGAMVLVVGKGTPFHRTIGGGYVVAMCLVNLSAFAIYRLTGHFEPFHAMALASLVALARGITAALLRRPGWLLTHYRGMAWSYLGLLAATAAEIGLRVFPTRGLIGHPWQIIAVGIAAGLAFLVLGLVVLPRLQRTALAYEAA
jgi:uncharacterized membrane protein